MAEKLKVRSPYDGHLIKEVDLDEETRIEQALTTAEKLEQKKRYLVPALFEFKIPYKPSRPALALAKPD